MSSDAHPGDDDAREPLADVPTACYDVLRSPRRLRLLEILGERGERLSLGELTTALLERERPDAPRSQARHEIRTALVHNHLPRLADYDIVDWDVDTGAEFADGAPFQLANVSALLECCETSHGARFLETAVHPVRLPICSILTDNDRPLSVEQLASFLVTRGAVADTDRATIELHHSHLPALESIGVLEYDPDTQLVSQADRSLSAIV
ncbi:DUF7344 domain-containing protein [Halosolutus gelatinilyticus]|uniref:DUF7344 domain-containing protein n=1 Tax=Halosolutus gelatinilyticus TaxID=2931975 RepID=UPI001FF51376|nr:ArsR family transcriptional regulator [Halosolutus gelatinilyticus]